jgi:hypothetical protein
MASIQSRTDPRVAKPAMSLRDRLTGYMAGGLDLFETDARRKAFPNISQDMAKDLVAPLYAVPGIGQGLSAEDLGQASQSGNKLEMAMAILGLIPGVGGEAKAVKQAATPLKEGRQVLTELAAPAVHAGGNKSLVEKIYRHAEQERTPSYPPAKEPVFDTSGNVEQMTKELVPQQSIAAQLPQTPSREFLSNQGSGRSRQIMDNSEAIGAQMAKDLALLPQQGRLPFYSTGPVLAGMSDKAGLSPGDALAFMHDWAGQGAATSPRTKTPPNLRNASYLQYRRAQGDPVTSAVRQSEGNRPGFPMMGMHTDLAEQFASGTADPLKNSKPFTFRENWTGNMADVTADTHNIRKVLDTYDQLFPGTLDRGWFNDQAAYEAYKAGKGFPKEGMLPVGDIADALESNTVKGQKIQYEYPIIQGPTKIAAERLGISPAEAQERLWFQGGPRTGLASPPMTIPDLLNAQIEKTAKVLGLPPDVVLKMWAQRGIPLAENEEKAPVPGTSMVG